MTEFGSAHGPGSHGAAADAPPESARTWAMLCHVAGFGGYLLPLAGSIVLPMILWLIKRDDHPFIDDQGREALNFQLTLIVFYIVAGILVLLLVGFLFLLLIPLYQIVMIIVAAVKSHGGERFRYPLTIRFLS
jgi:uncharacterized protein